MIDYENDVNSLECFTMSMEYPRNSIFHLRDIFSLSVKFVSEISILHSSAESCFSLLYTNKNSTNTFFGMSEVFILFPLFVYCCVVCSICEIGFPRVNTEFMNAIIHAKYSDKYVGLSEKCVILPTPISFILWYFAKQNRS